MDIVTAAIDVSLPRDDVFAFVADQRNRARLLPDNFTQVRMLTDQHTGVGARFGFTVQTDRGAYQSETEITSCQAPVSLVEHTEDGETVYDTHWRFEQRDSTTHVAVETNYPAVGNLFTRLLARTFGRRALEQSLLVELIRLKQLLETP